MKLGDWLKAERRHARRLCAPHRRLAGRGDADLPRKPRLAVARDRRADRRRDAGRRHAQRFPHRRAAKGAKDTTCIIPSTAAIEAFARGEIVVVTDDDDRENEGDLVVAASLCTTEKMAFIIRNSCGIVCAPLTGGRRAAAASGADGGLERRAAWHGFHRFDRRQARHDHRHFGRAALQHGARARQRQHGRERFRPARPRLPARRTGRRRADALGPYRSGASISASSPGCRRSP